MKTIKMLVTLAPLFFWLLVPPGKAQDASHVKPPNEHTYVAAGGRDLKAYVFLPEKRAASRAAILLFHGGGWYMGEAAWAFSRARYFASRGLVAVAVQYRLSDQKTITPLEAMSDARASIRWVRSQSATLGIHASRIIAYGWSAGAHLAVSAAIFRDTTENTTSHIPDALVMISPALQLERDQWVQQLLGKRAIATSISPVAHVRKGMPPTLILQGSDDTVTPLRGAELFRDRMTEMGNRCDLQVYQGVGHLFTPKGIPDDGWPQPDSTVQALAFQRTDDFLVSIGFLR